MLKALPAQALIRNRIPASRRRPKFQVLIDFNCAANLGGGPAVLKRNGNCLGGGGGPPIIKQGPTLGPSLALQSLVSQRSGCLPEPRYARFSAASGFGFLGLGLRILNRARSG